MRKPSQPTRPEPEPEKFERWTAQREAAIILEVLKAQISVPEACRKHGITQGEFRPWVDEYHRGGVDSLKVNKKGLDVEYRAEGEAFAVQDRRARDGKRDLPRSNTPSRARSSSHPRVAARQSPDSPRYRSPRRPIRDARVSVSRDGDLRDGRDVRAAPISDPEAPVVRPAQGPLAREGIQCEMAIHCETAPSCRRPSPTTDRLVA